MSFYFTPSDVADSHAGGRAAARTLGSRLNRLDSHIALVAPEVKRRAGNIFLKKGDDTRDA